MTAQAIMSGGAMTVQMGNRTSGLINTSGHEKEKTSSGFFETVNQIGTRSEFRAKTQDAQRNNNTVAQRQKPGTGKRTPAKELNSLSPSENFLSPEINENMPEKMSEETVPAEAIERLYTAVANIVDYLAEELSVTAEELTESLDGLSLSFEDLTKPEGIVKFIVGTEFEGDPALALNDPDFPEVIQEVLKFAEEQMNSFEGNNISAEEVFREIAENGQIPGNIRETENISGLTKTDLFAEAGKTEKQTEFENVSEEDIFTEEENELLTDMSNTAVKEENDLNEDYSSENGGNAFEKDAKNPSVKDNSKTETSAHGKITMGQFIDNLVQAAQTGGNASQAAEQVSFRDVAFQVIEQVKVTNFTGETRLSMMLSPESLGRVELMISTKEGVMTASLTTETQVAKEALESQMVTLKENLETQGIKVETIEVNVSDFHFEDGDRAKENGDRKKGEKKNFIYFDEEDGIMTETNRPDALLEQVFLENGSTVSYRA